MLGFKNFLTEEDGVGVVEMVLIVVVLIGIVILFRDKLKKRWERISYKKLVLLC